MLGTLRPNINSSAIAMLEAKLANATSLDLSLQRIGGANVIQFSAETQVPRQQESDFEAGLLLAELCLGGGGQISVVQPTESQISRPHVAVATANPLVDCIGCQYAGWSLSVGDYSAMTSGPIRLLRGSEAVLEQYGLSQTDVRALVIIESSRLPTEQVVRHIAHYANVAVENLFICVAKTSSLPGAVQVVARSVETAMHKLHEIGFDLAKVRSGYGIAPLPPVTDSDLTAMGWTNDAILYGASVELTVDATDDEVATIIDQVPSNSCDQFGKSFLEIFNEAGRDFYEIDPLLFAPAQISIVNQSTGNSFSAGHLRADILKTSFEI